ncbi:MAG: alanine racemase [Phycisphaerales bacterium]|nr:alanine racemase [Phycisphaerales bacterium]NNM25336.1 alanine racemase [Phycisphaerales bacterium]
MRDLTVLEIDLTAVAHNMAVLRRLVGPRVGICPVVKADAYGLGAARVCPTLLAAGAEMLAVYTADQAAELLRAAVGGTILVMMPVRSLARGDELEHALVRGRLHLTVHDRDQLADLVRLSERYTTPIPVHLDIDTGMTRGGCLPADAPELIAAINDAPRLKLAGISTHFSSAGSDPATTDRQLARLERLLKSEADAISPVCIVHAANTAATLRTGAYHQRMVRIGQAWAGYGPELIDEESAAEWRDGAHDLRPCVTLSSRLIQIKSVPARTKVGYEAAWTTRRASVIGLVPTGYADGYPLALSGAGRRRRETPLVAVMLQGPSGLTRTYAPVVGRVNMDQITIDLTEIAADKDTPPLRVGTGVELITADRAAPNHLAHLATIAGTSPYELLCRLNPRLRRVYHRASASIEVMPGAAAAARAAATAAAAAVSTG